MVQLENLLVSRSVSDYGAFLLPSLTADMTLLDCGCGPGSITYGLADRLDRGQVVGLDVIDGLWQAREYARDRGRQNLSYVRGDVDALPFPEGRFDAVFAHSLIEMLSPPYGALTEMRRVMKANGVIGVAAVDYSGLLLAGPSVDLLERFYQMKEQVWQSAFNSEPRRGKHLRNILSDAGFRNVQAGARYVSYGDGEAVRQFGEGRARECEGGDIFEAAVATGLSNEAELQAMSKAWRSWGESPGAFLAFPWCNAVGWK